MSIRFGPFVLEPDTRQLKRNDAPVHLPPKAFDLLQALVLERPRVLSKSALQNLLWPDAFVVEANLSNLVAEIRDALDDDAKAPRYIRTVHGFGYAFCGDATSVPATDAALESMPCWLEWGPRHFPLPIGEHVIGRDPAADIRLDAATVSRRHARVVVTSDGVVLEDFASKNGTRRRDQPVTAPVALADGDVLRIGALKVTFRTRGLSASTDTHVTQTV